MDPELLAFALTGSKKIDMNIENPNTLPWMTNAMFAELDALSKIRPFTTDNMIEHISNNPVLWDSIYQGQNIIFSELPNRHLIDFSSFLRDDIILPQTSMTMLPSVQTNRRKKSSSKMIKNFNTASGADLMLPGDETVRSTRKIVIDD